MSCLIWLHLNQSGISCECLTIYNNTMNGIILQTEQVPDRRSKWTHNNWAVSKEMCLRACAKYIDSDSSHACTKSDLGLCSSLIHSIVSIDSVVGEQRHWSDCANQQTRLLLSAYVRRLNFEWRALINLYQSLGLFSRWHNDESFFILLRKFCLDILYDLSL